MYIYSSLHIHVYVNIQMNIYIHTCICTHIYIYVCYSNTYIHIWDVFMQMHISDDAASSVNNIWISCGCTRNAACYTYVWRLTCIVILGALSAAKAHCRRRSSGRLRWGGELCNSRWGAGRCVTSPLCVCVRVFVRACVWVCGHALPHDATHCHTLPHASTHCNT